MTMITVVNTIRIEKGRAEEVLARFKTPKSVHTFDGFILMEVLKKENSPEYDELKICTTWENRASFENWSNSRESQNAHGKKREEKLGDNPILGSKLTSFEVAVQHKPAKQEV